MVVGQMRSTESDSWRIAAMSAVFVVLVGSANAQVVPAVNVCEIFAHPADYEDRELVVSGVYYFGGLAAPQCRNKLRHGGQVWPAVISLQIRNDARSTHGRLLDWSAVERTVLDAAKRRSRCEVQIVVRGKLKGPFVQTPAGKTVGAFGVQGVYPAELVVSAITAVKLDLRPTYDHSKMVPKHQQ